MSEPTDPPVDDVAVHYRCGQSWPRDPTQPPPVDCPNCGQPIGKPVTMATTLGELAEKMGADHYVQVSLFRDEDDHPVALSAVFAEDGEMVADWRRVPNHASQLGVGFEEPPLPDDET